LKASAPQTRRWLLRLVQIGAAVGIFAILWHAADGREALRLLANADPWWFVGAIAALTVQTILSALRWRLTASRLGIVVDVRTAVREYYLSQVINQSLPGGMVGDAARAVRSRGQAGLAKAGQAVVLERLMGQIVMFLFLAGAFAATWMAPGGLVWPTAVAFPLALGLAAGFALPPLLWSATRMPGLLGRWAALLHEIIHAGLMQRGTLGWQVLLSIGTASCNLAAFAFCARAVGVTLPLGALLAIVPLVLFTMLIPLSMSGWGLREGAAAALFPIAGATARRASRPAWPSGLPSSSPCCPGSCLSCSGRRRRRFEPRRHEPVIAPRPAQGLPSLPPGLRFISSRKEPPR
jgi:glycosyltransferase 2 family protein